MSERRVTAVIPAYNPGTHLARSLGSVLAQDYAPLDVVVVDDGSVESFADAEGLDDPRVTLVRTENRGVSAARNLAVALSEATFVAFLDQDDEWSDPRKISLQVAAHEADPGAAFVHTGFTWVLPDREQDASTPSLVSYASSMRGDGYVCLSSMMVRRDRYVTVGGHDLSLAQQQDWDLILKLLRLYGPAAAVPGPLVRYHVHGGNASDDYALAESESDQVYRRNSTPETLSIVREGRRKANHLYASKGIDAARAAFRARDTLGVVHHLAAAGRIAPTSVPRAALKSFKRRIDERL